MNDRDERRTDVLEDAGLDNPGSDAVDLGRDDRAVLRLNENDVDPTAGGSDIGGRAGEPEGSR
jgi:hypothetical protein